MGEFAGAHQWASININQRHEAGKNVLSAAKLRTRLAGFIRNAPLLSKISCEKLNLKRRPRAKTRKKQVPVLGGRKNVRVVGMMSMCG